MQGCYLLALVAGLYTAAGGLAAVVYTDILQTIILLIGSCIMLFAVLGQHGFSWSSAIQSVDQDMISLIRPIDDPIMPWLGTLVGVPLLGFYYWSTNQYVVQRILAAKNLENAQWGALLGGGFKTIVAFPRCISWPNGLANLPKFRESGHGLSDDAYELDSSGRFGIGCRRLTCSHYVKCRFSPKCVRNFDSVGFH